MISSSLVVSLHELTILAPRNCIANGILQQGVMLVNPGIPDFMLGISCLLLW